MDTQRTYALQDGEQVTNLNVTVINSKTTFERVLAALRDLLLIVVLIATIYTGIAFMAAANDLAEQNAWNDVKTLCQYDTDYC